MKSLFFNAPNPLVDSVGPCTAPVFPHDPERLIDEIIAEADANRPDGRIVAALDRIATALERIVRMIEEAE